MGSNSSRHSSAPDGCRRKLRPLIRSITCGMIFPPFAETEELSAGRRNKPSRRRQRESCRNEFAARREVQSLASSSVNGYKNNEIGLSVPGESNTRSGSRIAVGEPANQNCKPDFGRNKTLVVSGEENGNWHVGESSSPKDSDPGSVVSLANKMQTSEMDCVDGVDRANHLDQPTHMEGQVVAPVASEEASQVSAVYVKPVGPSQLQEVSQVSAAYVKPVGPSQLQETEMPAIPNETETQSENFGASTDSLVLNSESAEHNSMRNLQLSGDASLLESILARNPESRESENASMLQVEAAIVSSSELSGSSGDVSNQEARRTSRRRLWDALTRATSRRRSVSPTIVLSREGSDELGSLQGRWLLDITGGSYDDPFGNEGGFINDRNHYSGERGWRSQIWALQRLGSDSDGISERSGLCASGLHLDGHCSCEAYVMTEGTNSRTSISRIVMLVEALFEVLEEIHHQSVALSRSTSLSLLCPPAPDPVVDSFPLRVHKKPEQSETADDEVAQCHICLLEYEAGDRIRVLPCHHEYHMACADKWLKEFHRVCPLCRGNVCELSAVNSTTSNS